MSLRVRPANFQRMPVVRWKLHGYDLAENRTVGSPWLVFHENGPYSIIWAFKKPKKWPKTPKFRIFQKTVSGHTSVVGGVRKMFYNGFSSIFGHIFCWISNIWCISAFGRDTASSLWSFLGPSDFPTSCYGAEILAPGSPREVWTWWRIFLAVTQLQGSYGAPKLGTYENCSF